MGECPAENGADDNLIADAAKMLSDDVVALIMSGRYRDALLAYADARAGGNGGFYMAALIGLAWNDRFLGRPRVGSRPAQNNDMVAPELHLLDALLAHALAKRIPREDFVRCVALLRIDLTEDQAAVVAQCIDGTAFR